MSSPKINSYNGNSNLKQIGWEHQYTKEQVEEIIKSSAFFLIHCLVFGVLKDLPVEHK